MLSFEFSQFVLFVANLFLPKVGPTGLFPLPGPESLKKPIKCIIIVINIARFLKP